MKSRAVVLLVPVLLAACSSGDPVSDPLTSTSPRPAETTTSVPVSVPGGSGQSASTCTEADLNGPVLTMPTGKVVTAPVVIEPRYKARLLPAGEAPRIDAATAWQALLRVNPMRARSGELLFGTFRATVPFGQHGPQKFNIHAWVLRVKHIVHAYPPDESAAAAGSPTKLPLCAFSDGFFVIDSNDGADVFNSF